ncbi:MAG TPA: nuclear transport factor 2 family protein [Longimicrobiales bacterium]|nr:nuclear transport factor 2 family protein [Longimicrobiales bacterium]
MIAPTRAVLLLAATAIAAAPTSAQDASTSGDARAEVLRVVTTLFDGMREKDEAKLRSVFHGDARLHTAGAAAEGTPIESFIRSVVSGPAELDEVTFDEEVLVDGPLAVAWTPYNFFADGEFSHCGVNAFTLMRSDDGWKILQIVDTRVREGCDPSRRG